jgi:hypothetical protein
MKSSRITAISCRTTGIPKGWEEPGETTIRTISRQSTGGATQKRDRPDSTTEEIPDVMKSDYHKWTQGLTPEQIQQQIEFYKKRYNQ